MAPRNARTPLAAEYGEETPGGAPCPASAAVDATDAEEPACGFRLGWISGERLVNSGGLCGT